MTTAENITIEIWTEGKTDWRLLKKAAEKLGLQMPLVFHEEEKPMGDDKLLNVCKTFAQRDNPIPLVFIFDRDNENIVRDVSDRNNPYKSWGNNVYSFVIPEPNHRKGFTNISIELLFTDDELFTKDVEGRRLFLTSEFNKTSGKLKTNKLVSIGNKGILKNCADIKTGKIVDTDVYDESDQNIALSKSQFTDYISSDAPFFDSFDFSEFKLIFDTLGQIARDARRDRNVYVPNFEELLKQWEGKAPAQQMSAIFDTMNRLIALVLQVFIISTIRFYEDAIVNEPVQYSKKVKPIRIVLKEKFFSPSLKSIQILAEKCFYLVDESAPISLQSMKKCLGEVFTLENLGKVLDDLERIFPPKRGTPIQTNKSKINRALLDYVIGEFAKYEGKLLLELEEFAEPLLLDNSIQIEMWRQALLQLVQHLNPMLSQPVELRSLESVDSRTGKYTIEKRTYSENTFYVEELQISADEAEEYQTNYSHLLLDEGLAVHLFPMLLVKENALYFYQRSRASGYEYYSLVNDRVHIEPIKKKFNHAVFKTGSTQEFFWTDVIPTVNPDNNVRANIPQEGLDDFIGRTRQKRTIREEILEIPNRDGIVFGPGGIGKTALIQQLTHELYFETDVEKVLFDNIVWVSAKSDYYDYIFGTIEEREQFSRSLDAIVTALLEFFEFGELDEYDFDDKRHLLLEVLSENRTLLVIDNFETIPEVDSLKIIKFFGTEVKRYLRHKPDQFKVIVTSRKQIPSGFHQIRLEGLDLRESRLLIRQLQERYRSSSSFTNEQENAIHKSTQGIPIVIKHSFGQLFEFNRPLQSVLRELTLYKSKIIQFSYKEILQQIEDSDQSGIQLKVLLLLESLNHPMLISQIAEIIGVSDPELEEKLPLLANFQCLRVTFKDGREQYAINNEIRLLTKSLAQKHADIVRQLRERVATTLVEQELDATTDEKQLAQMFENYLAEGQLLDAEAFIEKQLEVWPRSILLSFHYARYLVERRRDYDQAIKVLEKVREASNNNPKILSLLVDCYTSLEIPKYEVVEPYVIELENYIDNNQELYMRIAGFYVDWSSLIKSQYELDPIKEKIRQQRYKDLADKALTLLKPLQGRQQTDQYYYLCAKCYYNKWDYENAWRMITKAIKIAEVPNVYEHFRRMIVWKEEQFQDNRLKSK